MEVFLHYEFGGLIFHLGRIYVYSRVMMNS